jgi:hypothetical protein
MVDLYPFAVSIAKSVYHINSHAQNLEGMLVMARGPS